MAQSQWSHFLIHERSPWKKVSVTGREFPSYTHHHREVLITRRREFIAPCEQPADLSHTHPVARRLF